jgi:hypothetical protein
MTNAEIEHTAPAATAKFRQWAQDTNADIGHWAQRWNESLYLQNFSMITIPHKTQHPMSAAKFGDFWRFWLLGVLKQGKYGLSVGEIYGGLAEGAGESYVPGLAFKHWRPGNFEQVRLPIPFHKLHKQNTAKLIAHTHAVYFVTRTPVRMTGICMWCWSDDRHEHR